MKFKLLLTSALMMCGVLSANAQLEDGTTDVVNGDNSDQNVTSVASVHEKTIGFGGKHNRFKIDVDFGWYISEFVDENGKGHRGIQAVGASFSYQHVFNSGYGFGLNFIRDIGSDGIMTEYLGPSFVNYQSKDKWTYGYAIGLGYGHFSFDSNRFGYNDCGGLGYFVEAEVERRFTKWFGLGGGLRVFNITAKKPEGARLSGSYGTGLLNLYIGPRFYF